MLEFLNAAIEVVQKDYESTSNNMEIAKALKEEFERKFYPTWICIVGKIKYS